MEQPKEQQLMIKLVKIRIDLDTLLYDTISINYSNLLVLLVIKKYDKTKIIIF
jgi:hypothetical protein